MSADGKTGRGALIVYDGQCPFCSRYVRLIRLRQSVGPVELLDARQNGPAVAEINAAGVDLNEGMALKLGDRWHYGDECVHMLALLSTPSTMFNKLNGAVFRSRPTARLLYPVLRAGRNLALWLLGRDKIHRPSAQG
jgi:predicted DCC family thiol-disulfide oxidoreductase YuxK